MVPFISLVMMFGIGAGTLAVRPVHSGRTVLAARVTTGDATRSALAAVDAMDKVGSAAAEYGVAVLDRHTGKLSLGDEGAIAFYSASVVKLFTVVDILHRTEVGQVTLTAAQRTDIQRALTVSDDRAMDALWKAFGGSSTVTELIGLAGLKDTQAPVPPGEWGLTKVSPRDVVAVYEYALTKLNSKDRSTVLGDLAAAQNVGADGFDQAFGLLQSPRPGGVAAKQGWMTDGPSLYLHSTGVLGPGHRYVIAVLSKQAVGTGYPAGRANVSSATKRLTGALGLKA